MFKINSHVLVWVSIIIFCLVFWGIVFVCLVRADEIDDIIPAIIEVESGGNPNAVSPCGAIGLMQITPIVLKEWNNQKSPPPIYRKKINILDIEPHYLSNALYDEDVNISIGNWYLHRIKDHYLKDKYTIERMLACYNGGYNRLKKCNYDINKMPKETRNYVKKVIKLYKKETK